MKGIKKVFMGFSIFITGLISKVFAMAMPRNFRDFPELKYGVFEPTPTVGERISVIGKIAVPIVLFIIGFFVILNKRIANKTKAIIISVLAIIGILTSLLFNCIVNN